MYSFARGHISDRPASKLLEKDTMAAVTFEELEAIIEEEGETLIVDVRSQAEFSQVYRCNMAITGSKN